MKHLSLSPILLAAAVVVGACGAAPRTTSLLDQTRTDYRVAQSNTNVARYAAVEMRLADEAMAQANASAGSNESVDKVDNLAYLAKQKIALAQEVGKQKAAEAEVSSAGKERDQMRLDQRTNEADQAKSSAEQAKQAALAAQSDTAQAQRQTQLAQDQTADSQRQIQDAKARAASFEAQLATLAAQKTERGLVITLGDVLFGIDLARLNTQGMQTVQKLAAVLQQNPQRNVLIEGFTDSTGGTAHNQELSERRASAVRLALLEMGVGAERVAMRGYGEAYAVAANDTAQNRQLNRRVEIVVSDATGKISTR